MASSTSDETIWELLKKWEYPENMDPFDFSIIDVYHPTESWRNIPFVPCDILSGKIIHKAFKDMCRLLFLSTEPSDKALHLACLLSAQLRSPENHQSLLIDQEKFRPTFRAREPEPIENFFITDKDEEYFGEPRANFLNFLASVDGMDEIEAMIFGPAFASVIATLKKCSARTAANKIFFLKNNLKKFYPRSRITVRLPPKEILIDILHKHKETYPDEYKKNTAFLGCMFAYHKQDVTAEIKEMLDTLVLKSFRYASMQLLTFVDEVTKAYGCSVDEYRQFALANYHQGDISWKAYDKFMAKYGPEQEPEEDGQLDSFWMYAREFNHDFFREFTYTRNPWLCNFSADLLDLKLHSDRVKAWPVLGPTYHNLTKYKRSEAHMLRYSEKFHKLARRAHRQLNALRQK